MTVVVIEKKKVTLRKITKKVITIWYNLNLIMLLHCLYSNLIVKKPLKKGIIQHRKKGRYTTRKSAKNPKEKIVFITEVLY